MSDAPERANLADLGLFSACFRPDFDPFSGEGWVKIAAGHFFDPWVIWGCGIGDLGVFEQVINFW